MDRDHARSTALWAGDAIALAGIWLIVAPFVLGYAELTEPRWNGTIVGAAVLGSIWAEPLSPRGGLGRIHAALGAWLIAAPFVLGYARMGGETTGGAAVTENGTLAAIGAEVASWNETIVGVVVLILALWRIAVGRRSAAPAGAQEIAPGRSE